ncbi:MAG: DUF1036 domain-containing protein [Pseudomonadota bacterium]
MKRHSICSAVLLTVLATATSAVGQSWDAIETPLPEERRESQVEDPVGLSPENPFVRMQYGWRICNETSEKLWYAVSYRAKISGGGRVWHTRGWYEVPVGSCDVALDRIEESEAYFYAQSASQIWDGDVKLCGSENETFSYQGRPTECPAGLERIGFIDHDLGGKSYYETSVFE